MAYKDLKDPRNREAKLRHYRKNKSQYQLRSKLVRQTMMEFVNELKTVPCMDCHNKFPAVAMDFDHRNPTEKLGSIAKFVTQGNWNKLKAELKKCDIVCANCHRIRTHSGSSGNKLASKTD